MNVIPTQGTNGTSIKNLSVDVTVKGCFGEYDTVACVRSGILAGLDFITLVLCIHRIVRLHVLHHPQIHQYLIFYFATVEVSFLGPKWVISIHDFPWLEFGAIYMKMIQFILICHFHWSLATRILHKEKLIKIVILPILGLFFAYFTVVAVLAIISTDKPRLECLEPYWLMMSAAEFLFVQLFMTAGVYITQKINAVSSMDSFKREQKRDLWSVIVAYEFSALVALSYDTTIQIMGDQDSGCSGIYGHTQSIYSPVFAFLMVIKYLLPIWVMILVFHPVRGWSSDDDDRLLGISGDGSTTSTFNSSSRGHLIYQQLRFPGSESDLISPTCVSVATGMRRSASTPAFLSNVHHRAILTPITEEEAVSQNTSLPSSSAPNADTQTDIKVSNMEGVLSPSQYKTVCRQNRFADSCRKAYLGITGQLVDTTKRDIFRNLKDATT